MNLNRDPESWARVNPDAFLTGSIVQARNVIEMAVQDIAKLAAEIERLKVSTLSSGRGLMAFKCYCPQCDTPLYFEEAVPMPQICFSCLTGQVERDYPRCRCPRFVRCPKLSTLPSAQGKSE